MLTIAVVNLKGGTGKTTTAAFCAHVLHEVGHRVLVVDADPQRSASSWHRYADWPMPVVELATKELDRRVPGIVGDRFDAVVIDTPPSEDRADIVTSAVRAATHVLIPIAPTGHEYERTSEVRRLLDAAVRGRPDGRAPVVAVLLVKTVARAAATGVYRDLLTEDGWTVLRVPVAGLQRFAQSFGEPIQRAVATAYGDAVSELLALDVEEVSA